MDEYDNFNACDRLNAFVDALSNWYVRRGRERYWSGDKQSPDKLDAYWTLYECLLTTSKLIAPFVPFLAEHLWQNLARRHLRAACRRQCAPLRFPFRMIRDGSTSSCRSRCNWLAKFPRWAAALA